MEKIGEIRVFTFVSATSPEEARLWERAAGRVEPPVSFRQYDLSDPQSTELAARALFLSEQGASLSGLIGVSKPQTLEDWRENVERQRGAGKVVVALSCREEPGGLLSDFWSEVRRMKAAQQEQGD